MRDKLLFAVIAIGVSLALFVAHSAAFRADWALARYNVGILIPVLAVMVAGLGVGWARKAAFVAITVGGFLLIEWVAQRTGLRAIAAGTVTMDEPLRLSLGVLYVTLTPAFPIVMLALFVGRNPAVLWTRRGARR